ncbi:hypothetical protein Tco_0886514 [Tanacetum coccineum]
MNDYDCDIRYHPGLANVVADAISRKERAKPLRVRAMVMRIHTNLPLHIRDAQVEAFKEENIKNETLRDIERLRHDLGNRRSSYEVRIFPANQRNRQDGEIEQNLSEGSSLMAGSANDQSEMTIQTLEDMLRACAAPFEALYERKCQSPTCWAEAARDRQKSYADVRRKPLEFQVGDKAMLKVSPWKRRNTFWKTRKAKPKKCLSDETLVIPLEEIQVDDKPYFVTEPVEIMDRKIKRLKQSRIPIVTVR